MNLLLDTHALLWWRQGDRRLGRRSRTAVESGANRVFVSAVTVWEIAVKWRIGALRLPDTPDVWFARARDAAPFDWIGVTIDHALAVASLPDHHRDPFDRMLVAQARLEHLTIVTADTAFENYDVRLLDARS